MSLGPLLLTLAVCAPASPVERGATPADAGVRVGVASAMEKPRPGEAPPGNRAIALQAARGECESAQVVVRAERPIRALNADAPPLGGPVEIPVSLYRVVAIPLARGSGPDGAAGAWPDALVPARDPFFGEARRAFPVALRRGETQAIWVELCVPQGAPPGLRRGEVTLRDGRRELARVPLALEVWPLSIPATSSVPVTFGLSTRTATAAVGRPMDPELSRALAAAALRHRVTPHGLSHDPPTGRCTAARCALDWAPYDAEMAPILDGALVPGARGTWAEARIPRAVWEGPEADLRATLRAWRDHFERRGWADRLWLYTIDEPKPEQLPELARRARIAREAGVRTFVTARPEAALAGLVSAWAPNLVFFEPHGAGLAFRARAAGPAREAHRPFWYVSCLSHGCDELPARGAARDAMVRQFQGWPGYEIDRPSAAARAVAWLAWREQVAGELYFDMIQAWRGDPWKDPRAFAGNGDGTLLYPGLPSAWGGSRIFPVESIRLKVIRDGLEDLELLRLAEEAGLGAEAERIAARVASSLRGFERRPEPWLAARDELAALLLRSSAARPASAAR